MAGTEAYGGQNMLTMAWTCMHNMQNHAVRILTVNERRRAAVHRCKLKNEQMQTIRHGELE